MFPFPPAPPARKRVPRFPWGGCPIRRSADQRVQGPSPPLFAAVLRPSSALPRQGIHHPLSVPSRSRAPSLWRSRRTLVALCTW
jgi:hypothetical protein